MDRVLEGISILITTILSLVGGFGGTEPAEHAVVFEAGTVVAVLDGDTIIVDIDGKEEFVRYIGIDTPEEARDGSPEECFAEEATSENTRLVHNQTVQLERDEKNRDQYNRLLRYVYADGVLINAELVRGGFARTLAISPNTRHAGNLHDSEEIARDESHGLWEECI